MDLFPVDWQVADRRGGSQCFVTLYGKLLDGRSVAAHIRWYPSFFVALPPDPQAAHRLAGRLLGEYGAMKAASQIVQRKSLWGFSTQPQPFLLLAFSTMAKHSRAKYALRRTHRTFEGDVDPLLRLFHVRDIAPGRWVRMESFEHEAARTTVCDIEVTCEHSALFPSRLSDPPPLVLCSWDIECVSESRTSFPKASSEGDKIVCIGSVFARLGDTRSERVAFVLGGCAPNNLPEFEGTEFVSCSSEVELLERWIAKVVERKADIMLGWNTWGAPEPARLSRPPAAASVLDMRRRVMRRIRSALRLRESRRSTPGRPDGPAARGPVQARQRPAAAPGHGRGGRRCGAAFQVCAGQGGPAQDVDPAERRLRGQQLLGHQLAGCGGNECLSHFPLPAGRSRTELYLAPAGILQFDLMQSVKRSANLESYSLKAVTTHYLPDQANKLDMSPLQLFEAFGRGLPLDLLEIAQYCIRDCELPLLLSNKLSSITSDLEMSSACSVPFSYLLSRGQQVKVFSQVLKKARQMGFVCPDNAGVTIEGTYEGATVLQPVVGAHMEPTTCMDFASLYPSIIRAHNFCYSTIVLDPAHADLPGLVYKTVETGLGSFRYVQNSEHRGVLPALLEELAEFRKAARKKQKELEDAGDIFGAKVCNSAQLAFKISMNSV